MFVRSLYMNKLEKYKNTEFVKVITGVRRSGKTFILRMFRDQLLKDGISEKQIIFINFESMKYRNLLNNTSFYEYVMDKSLDGQKMYLFFDEIQRVEGWEDAVNSFRVDLNADIYVSGSNASLLSGELATLLTGRMVEVPVFPLSFEEYVQFKEFKDNPEQIFNDYVEEGGFPAVALINDSEVKRSVIDGIYSAIILRDVNERASVRNDDILTSIASYLLSEIGNPISTSKITGVLKNEKLTSNATSVMRYIQLLEEAFIFYKAQRYDLRGKSRLKTLAKYYAVDTGIRNTTLNESYRDNYGHQLENIVYIELLRRGYMVDVGRYDNQEIDFIAKKGPIIEYYQVTMQLPINSDREVGNLKKLNDNYRKVVITANKMNTGNDAGIEIIYIVDWLLENKK
ncbi:ATP-binding protein [Pediococcus stilesii]|uniref:ATP-binding protein n=1 Tax=Pediococcus stilesii TaxID=331679 RepID=A0A5R9BWZ3_9LACO|nr:ATP-binding protein [Pediococcus stilesii]TLQ05157.1 ATP-binding protein [Pediococcus stilesii]